MTLPDYTDLTLKEKEELRQRTVLRPPLRFPGFTQPWRTDRVKNVFDKITRGKVLSARLVRSTPDEEYKYPVYSSQTKNYGILGWYNQYLYEDVITWTTDGAYAGEVKFRKGKFYNTNVSGVLMSNSGLCNNCMAEAINKLTKLYITNGVYEKLMNKNMGEVLFTYPEEPEEQKKLSKLFAELDKSIRIAEELYEQTFNIRKGLIERMFTLKDGIPLLCFPEFYHGDDKESQKWQTKKVKEVVTFYNSAKKSLSEKERIPGTTPYLGSNNVQDYVEGYTHDGENVVLSRLGANDLLNYPVRITKGKIWANDHVHVIRGNEGVVENSFLAAFLRGLNFHPICVGGTRPQLNRKGLEEVNVSFPAYEEQEKIGKLFMDFQDLLEAYEKRIKLLKLRKKALLQQMFC
ncbi:hypothetical protein CKF54_07890 [Psittacicella hinzii]|uniref:Type I restriction modification DNA specificity domain-containing protein n=1 Tax=Psittacicella hinzii TaxID=2028575 RepID=A0A3A1Y192_9GAMM|nr:restriction endonuclease subunit S [Psittacicella hinzii]RIY31059.1 hypothetical protein CKF54_07890 [Psittacicella hinzii]